MGSLETFLLEILEEKWSQRKERTDGFILLLFFCVATRGGNRTKKKIKKEATGEK